MNDLVAPISTTDFKAEAHRDPWSVPLDEIDVSNPHLYSEDTWHGFFARLRRDDPVHFCDSPLYGPLRRQPAGGDAADDPVGGNPEALPADRGRGEAEASLLKPDPRHHRDEQASVMRAWRTLRYC